MPAPEGMTTTAQITVKAREVDFTTQFNETWKKWFQIMGIIRPIEKKAGTTLKSYVASVDGDIPEQVGEGEDVPLTKTKVIPVSYQDLTLEKHRKAVTAEAVAKYGATVAVQKTDAAFRNKLFRIVLKKFYTFMLGGKLVGTKKTWQEALAVAKAAVINRFEDADLEVTEVVGFANIMDYANYLGTSEITTQTMEGIQYVENFLGYKTLFLMSDSAIPRKKVVAIPTNNIDMYFVNPGDEDFKTLGLDFTVDSELGLIGFHANGNYTNFSGESQAMMGMTLWAEYLDGICVVDVGDEDKDPEIVKTSTPEASTPEAGE